MELYVTIGCRLLGIRACLTSWALLIGAAALLDLVRIKAGLIRFRRVIEKVI
jgi:hypothetical protein